MARARDRPRRGCPSRAGSRSSVAQGGGCSRRRPRLGGIERIGQPGEQRRRVVGRSQHEAALDRYERSPNNDPAVPAERAPGDMPAMLGLVRQQQFQLETGTRQQGGHADEPREDVLRAAAPRRAPARQDLAVAREADDPAIQRDRHDEADGVAVEQALELPPQRREAAGLDLDECPAADEICDVAIDGVLDEVARAPVPPFSCSVEQTLVQRPDHVPAVSPPRAADLRPTTPIWPKCQRRVSEELRRLRPCNEEAALAASSSCRATADERPNDLLDRDLEASDDAGVAASRE